MLLISVWAYYNPVIVNGLWLKRVEMVKMKMKMKVKTPARADVPTPRVRTAFQPP
jgi:hypothetical protein